MTFHPSEVFSGGFFYYNVAMKKCKYEKVCGGCDYQGLPYEKQLNKKQRAVENLLAPVLLKSGYSKEETAALFHPIIGADQPYGYRNKVHAVFGRGRNKKIICGTYEKGSHWVVDIDDCQIEHPHAVEMIRGIKDLMPSFRMQPYDEDKKTGLLRHVLIRVGQQEDREEYMVVLVTGTKTFPGKKNFVKAIVDMSPEITTVVWNINDTKTSMVLGDKEEVLFGPGYVTDELLGNRFKISPKSFYQVHHGQTEKLYTAAIAAAKLQPTDVVLDAYCGTGTIGICAAPHCGSVVGVELNPAAVADAKENAKKNGVENISFRAGDAGEYLLRQAAEGKNLPNVVIMDPPRSGSSKEFIQALQKIRPERIVYVSCGPQSLARDLGFLLRPKHGKRLYRVESIQPCDMFPMTNHCEAILCLSKNFT